LFKKYKMDLTQIEWAGQLKNDQNAVVLDVRTREEFEEKRLEHSINIDIYTGQAFIYDVDALDKTKNYFVYCKAGGRSAQACSIMNELGFANAYNLAGGIMNWEGKTI